jgi:3-mercaptopyruvate sulfurtransferase SseA
VALQLKKAGIRNVRPLAGGLDAWQSLGYPVEQIAARSSGEEAQDRLTAFGSSIS